jgi:nicotinamidase-related amidase
MSHSASRRDFMKGVTAAALSTGVVAASNLPAKADEKPAAAAPPKDLGFRPKVPGKLKLRARSRRDMGGKLAVVEQELEWNAAETAIIICDMWNQHWCASATQRVGALVRPMNEVVSAARSHGVQIVHAPSGTMDFYKDTPFRLRVQQAPTAEPPVPIQGWCYLRPDTEGELPIDDSDGGCDCAIPCKTHTAWSRQHPGLDIVSADGVSDKGPEIYNFFQAEGIKNVVLMGVHANMCVLGRPFGIRQLRDLGFHVALARDLTDTMYNPRSKPHVSHARGTELIVEHIEQHWCPSILGADLTTVVPGTAGPLA